MLKSKKPRKKDTLKAGRRHDLEYHVLWNESSKSWVIEVDGHPSGAFSYDRQTAIGNAVRDATRDHASGLDVIVCSQRADGSFDLEWPV